LFQIAHVGVSRSREIIFEVFQPIWSRIHGT